MKTPGDESLGLNAKITRRDFAGGVLAGAGAALLSTTASARQPAYPGAVGPEWTGPGGVGDYARSNGNTAEVVSAAHSLRDGFVDFSAAEIHDTGETFDLVVVGGGIAGLTAAFEFRKGSKGSVLVLDNHPIFGGESKQNEFVVDGVRMLCPQGANGIAWPPELSIPAGLVPPIWNEIGLPASSAGIDWVRRVPGDTDSIKYPEDNYDAMHLYREDARLGYFYKDTSVPGGHRWVIDPWINRFAGAPWPQQAKDELLRIENLTGDFKRADWQQWLDSMTYKEFLTRIAGVTRPEVFQYLDPVVAVHGPGLGCDVVSAYGAADYIMPGVKQVVTANRERAVRRNGGMMFVSLPGGNAGIARHFVKALLPEAIVGGHSFREVLYNRLNWQALDNRKRSARIRLGATVVRVRHDGPPASTRGVEIFYLKDRVLRRVRAKGVVMAGGQWMNKHILADAPPELLQAQGEFRYAPMLVANVAVKHWRFFRNVGISAARWFDGFGFFTNVRAPMSIDGEHIPLDPERPTVLTFYVPFTTGVSGSGMPHQAQAMAARTRLFATSFADFERQIREQLTALFADYGFDAQRDIAGIILNRWGHAYVSAQPGFFFGKDGAPAPRDLIRKGYGRIAFGHSDLSGSQGWARAVEEATRATRQILAL